jgi:hypothetical protein
MMLSWVPVLFLGECVEASHQGSDTYTQVAPGTVPGGCGWLGRRWRAMMTASIPGSRLEL